MKYAVCTSFNQKGLEDYGRTFISSFRRFWPDSVDLHVYSEEPGALEAARSFGAEITVHDLRKDHDLAEFLEWAPEDSGDYRWKARKFAYKVFAITDPGRPKADWWIWLDADTETIKPVTEDFLANVCPEGYCGSYLGRSDWPHSECGWVAYSSSYAGKFLDEFRRVYTSGELYSHLEWHDSYIFDRVREVLPECWFFNLSAGLSGMHPWPETRLGEVMRHDKGVLRKKGVTQAPGVPKEYWSEKERENSPN